jgi:hypothetical protein
MRRIHLVHFHVLFVIIALGQQEILVDTLMQDTERQPGGIVLTVGTGFPDVIIVVDTSGMCTTQNPLPARTAKIHSQTNRPIHNTAVRTTAIPTTATVSSPRNSATDVQLSAAILGELMRTVHHTCSRCMLFLSLNYTTIFSHHLEKSKFKIFRQRLLLLMIQHRSGWLLPCMINYPEAFVSPSVITSIETSIFSA